MPETLTDNPPLPRLAPCERVAQWEPMLRSNGWTTRITHTEQRARLEATHPTGAVVMVTSGMAGRVGKGTTKWYVLEPGDNPLGVWLGVRKQGMEEFIATRTLTGYRRRVETKCQCRTRAGRPKVRYATKNRAKRAMGEARRQRAADGQAETAECRTYRCPDDDRVWHVSSRRIWRDEPGDSSLWNPS